MGRWPPPNMAANPTAHPPTHPPIHPPSPPGSGSTLSCFFHTNKPLHKGLKSAKYCFDVWKKRTKLPEFGWGGWVGLGKLIIINSGKIRRHGLVWCLASCRDPPPPLPLPQTSQLPSPGLANWQTRIIILTFLLTFSIFQIIRDHITHNNCLSLMSRNQQGYSSCSSQLFWVHFVVEKSKCSLLPDPILIILWDKITFWAFPKLFPRHCVDCIVSCVLCWLHCVGKKNMGQSGWSAQSGGSTGRQSMNRMRTMLYSWTTIETLQTGLLYVTDFKIGRTHNFAKLSKL